MNSTEIIRGTCGPISNRIGLSILLLALTCSALTSFAVAQAEDKQSGAAVCTLDDGKQISARYTRCPHPCGITASQSLVPRRFRAHALH